MPQYIFPRVQEGRCKDTWKREFELAWREAGPPNHLEDEVDSEQYVVNKDLAPSGRLPSVRQAGRRARGQLSN